MTAVVPSTMPVVLCPARRRKHLTEIAQRSLNEWYLQNGKQPWELEHPNNVTPTTITGAKK